MIVPVILAGGAGTRLWPLSRSATPKQFLPLINHFTLLQNTLLRLQSISDIAAPIIICNAEHRFLVLDQLQTLNLSDATILLEPHAKNTAPAAALAALYLQQEKKEDPILLILPADHFIKNESYFSTLINNSMMHAQQNQAVVFGSLAMKPETGYGYIKTSSMLQNTHYTPAYQIEEFVEKPDIETAKTYIASGNYYWNSGIFMFRASHYLAELKIHVPDMLHACQRTIASIKKEFGMLHLDKDIFAACPSDSIDYAIMEKTKHAVLVPFETEWNDIGSWSALWEIQKEVRSADENGNVIQGDIFVTDVQNSYLHAESRMLAVVGLNNHVVIETPDAVLVAPQDKSQTIKQLVAQLKQNQRPEIDLHRKVYRPWGHYEILHQSTHFQIKHLTIKAGASLSLQMHQHRSEHWVVVNGTAQVTRAEEVFTLSVNESTYIPKAVKHRLVNATNQPLEIIETQLGNYLGEDDIIRFEDNYGRI